MPGDNEEDYMANSHFQFENPPNNQANKRVWINFKPDVDLGHLIAMCSFLGGLFVYAQSFDRRMTIIEQKQEVNTNATAETKADIKEIKNAVNKIGTDLAVQNAIQGARK